VKRIALLGLLFSALFAVSAEAQTYIRITTCGTAAPPLGSSQGYMDATGNVCTSAAGGGSSTAVVTPGSLTQVPLDVATVTTGGTAVTALTAGHRNKGGWIQNPVGAIALCINEIGTASGTTSAGNTTCIQGGQSYVLSPSTAAVSVISSDSSHPFSGMGLN
jgi:hypothetical protein